MNRKLHNTILAFSVTGVMLFLGLVVAQPALRPEQTPSLAPLAAETVAHARHDGLADAALAARIEAHARRLESEVARVGSASEALALTAGFIASATTEAALVGALSELRRADLERDLAAEDDESAERRQPPRRSSGSRDVIAVPYFSFARGSRGTGRS